MNVYIFKDVEQLTDRYHNEGGLVVIAKDAAHVERLIEFANGYTGDEWVLNSANIKLTKNDWEHVKVIPTNDDVEEDIYVFPNAGCC